MGNQHKLPFSNFWTATIVSILLLLLNVLTISKGGLMAESLTPSDKDIVKEVENCVQEARSLISQNNFEEAARRYERASKNLENIAEEKERTIKYKAFSHYLRGRSMVVEEILWRYREAKTEEAIGEFDKAESLYREIGNNVGTLVAEGWKEYMLGQKNELREDYTEATHFFKNQEKPSQIYRKCWS